MLKYLILIGILIFLITLDVSTQIWLTGGTLGCCVLWDALVLPLWRKRQRRLQAEKTAEVINQTKKEK